LAEIAGNETSFVRSTFLDSIDRPQSIAYDVSVRTIAEPMREKHVCASCTELSSEGLDVKGHDKLWYTVVHTAVTITGPRYLT